MFNRPGEGLVQADYYMSSPSLDSLVNLTRESCDSTYQLSMILRIKAWYLGKGLIYKGGAASAWELITKPCRHYPRFSSFIDNRGQSL